MSDYTTQPAAGDKPKDDTLSEHKAEEKVVDYSNKGHKYTIRTSKGILDIYMTDEYVIFAPIKTREVLQSMYKFYDSGDVCSWASVTETEWGTFLKIDIFDGHDGVPEYYMKECK